MNFSSDGSGWDNGDPGSAPYGVTPRVRSLRGLAWVMGAVIVILLVALAGMVGYVLASTGEPTAAPAPSTTGEVRAPSAADSDDAAADPRVSTAQAGGGANSTGCDPDQIADQAGIALRHVNVDSCLGDWALAHVYVPPGEPAGDTQYIVNRVGGSWQRYTGIPSTICRDDAIRDGMPTAIATVLDACRAPESGVGDLGLSTPMSRPSCDGRGIVVLYSAVTPGSYAQEISSALTQYPGASYLRTDSACPSLRARDENGNAIYAVYRPSGYTREALCSDVRAAGPPAYGRWLDTTSDPSVLVAC